MLFSKYRRFKFQHFLLVSQLLSPPPGGKCMGRGGEVSWGHWVDGQDLNPLTHPTFSWGEKGGHWKELGFAPPPSAPFSRGRGGAHWWWSWDLTSPDPHPDPSPLLSRVFLLSVKAEKERCVLSSTQFQQQRRIRMDSHCRSECGHLLTATYWTPPPTLFPHELPLYWGTGLQPFPMAHNQPNFRFFLRGPRR